jgi:hypothetical protein
VIGECGTVLTAQVSDPAPSLTDSVRRLDQQTGAVPTGELRWSDSERRLLLFQRVGRVLLEITTTCCQRWQRRAGTSVTAR